MASFDFIEVSAKGYEFVWDRLGYIVRVSIPVIFVKVVCLLTIFLFGIQGNLSTMGLFLLPSFLLEAIFAVGLIRYLIFREAIYVWGKPVLPPPQDKTTLAPLTFRHLKSAKAGIIMFLLIIVLQYGLIGFVQDFSADINQAKPEEPLAPAGAHVFFLSLSLMVAFVASFIWVFRLLYLYIPVTLEYNIKEYLYRMKGMSSSLCLIATYFICEFPLAIVRVGGMNMLEAAFTETSAVFIFSNALFQSLMSIITLSVQIVALTYGIQYMMNPQEKTEQK